MAGPGGRRHGLGLKTNCTRRPLYLLAKSPDRGLSFDHGNGEVGPAPGAPRALLRVTRGPMRHAHTSAVTRREYPPSIGVERRGPARLELDAIGPGPAAYRISGRWPEPRASALVPAAWRLRAPRYGNGKWVGTNSARSPEAATVGNLGSFPAGVVLQGNEASSVPAVGGPGGHLLTQESDEPWNPRAR